MSQGHQGWESMTLCFWEVQSESGIIWESLKGTGSWSHYPGSYVSLGIIFTWLREVLKCLHLEKWNIKNSNHPILCPQWLCIFNDFFNRGYKIELQSPLKKTCCCRLFQHLPQAFLAYYPNLHLLELLPLFPAFAIANWLSRYFTNQLGPLD